MLCVCRLPWSAHILCTRENITSFGSYNPVITGILSSPSHVLLSEVVRKLLRGKMPDFTLQEVFAIKADLALQFRVVLG